MKNSEIVRYRLSIYFALAQVVQLGVLDKGLIIDGIGKSPELMGLMAKLRRRDLYKIIFNRTPEVGWGVSNISYLNAYVSPEILYEFIFSEENLTCGHLIYASTFQVPVRIFVHIPKTAGTSLNSEMNNNSILLTNDDACDVLDLISRYSLGAPRKPIVLSGHRTLAFYDKYFDLCRAEQIFTIIRDPIDLAISFFNYSISKFKSNDVAWLSRHGAAVEMWLSAGGGGRSTFIKFIDSPFFNENVSEIYSRYLGGDIASSDEGGRSIIDNLARLGVLVVHVDKVDEYFFKPGKNRKFRENVSENFISRKDIDFDLLTHLKNRLAGPYEFYNLLDNFNCWRESGVIDFSSYVGPLPGEG